MNFSILDVFAYPDDKDFGVGGLAMPQQVCRLPVRGGEIWTLESEGLRSLEVKYIKNTHTSTQLTSCSIGKLNPIRSNSQKGKQPCPGNLIRLIP